MSNDTEEIARLRRACSALNDAVSQTLGRALGYPRFCDDPKNFPGATDADGVCVGDHVAASLADEAADTIRSLRAEVERLRTPSATCPACGSDANERDELTKAEREIDRLRAKVERLRADLEAVRKSEAGMAALIARIANLDYKDAIDAARAAAPQPPAQEGET